MSALCCDRLNALYVVMMSGHKADIALCEPFFKNESVYHETKYTHTDGKEETVITQVRDVAVAAALILHGEDPAAYEFDMLVLYKDRGVQQLKKPQGDAREGGGVFCEGREDKVARSE